MKKITTTIALLLLATPAVAQNSEAQRVARELAIIVGYHQNCQRIPDRVQGRIGIDMGRVPQAIMDAAISAAADEAATSGRDKFCRDHYVEAQVTLQRYGW